MSFFHSLLSGSSGGGFDSGYQAILSKGTSLGYALPSASQQTKQNTLFQALAPCWSLMRIFYVFATDGDSDYATLNWVDPNSFQASKVSSPTFTTNQGFKTNGTTSRLTSFNPSTEGGGIFTTNNHSIGLYTINNNLAAVRMGNSSGASNRLRINKTSTNALEVLLTRDPGFSAAGNTAKLIIGNRKDASTIAIQQDATLGGDVANNVQAFANNNMFICALNENGSPSFGIGTQGNASVVFFGSSLHAHASTIWNALNTYMTSL